MDTLKSSRDVVVFDVDGTLIKDNIGATFVRYLLAERKVKAHARLIVYVMYALYKCRILGAKAFVLLGAWALSGIGVEEVELEAYRCFEGVIKNAIYCGGKAEICMRRDEGCFVMLATGAHEAIASRLAEHLAADALIATKSRIRAGRFTMRVDKPLPFGQGKVRLVKELMKKQGLDGSITAYADDEKDLALLEFADHPVAVNAGSKIRELVLRKGGGSVEFR